MAYRQLRSPASEPAIVRGPDGREERAVYLTNPAKTFQGVRLPKDSKPARDVGTSPMPKKSARIIWA